MSQYFEVVSTFRNRNQWPNPAEFEVMQGQTGRRERYSALDPVSDAAPVNTWSSNAFNTTGPAGVVVGTVLAVDAPGVGASGNTSTIIEIAAAAGNTYQQVTDYYLGATLADITGTLGASKITGYKYLGQSAGVDRVQVIVSPALSSVAAGDTVEINDPTDLSDTSNPLFFIPNGRLGENAYSTLVLYNETVSISSGVPEFRQVTGYDSLTHLLSVDASTPVTTWSATDDYVLRRELPQVETINNNLASTTVLSLPTFSPSEQDIYRNSFVRVLTGAASGDIRRIIRYETFSGVLDGGGPVFSILPSTASTVDNYYTGMYIQYTSGSAIGRVRRVNSYVASTRRITINATPGTAAGDTFVFRSATVSEAFSGGVVLGDTIEILQYTIDNHNPLTYTGGYVSHQEAVCHDIELLNLILPNKILSAEYGSRIVFYPYVYVEIGTVSGSSSGWKNSIHSNNPNATSMTFRVPIDDTPDPFVSTFLNLDGDGMVQRLKFKPTDSLRFSVRLPDGSLFRTSEAEYFSPNRPNPDIQISALFKIRRVQ